jgi:hypothetical protein
VLLDAGEPPNPKRQEPEFVLEPAELALDRAALVIERLEPVGAAGNQGVKTAGLDPLRRGLALAGRAAPL